jgi:hypothetical protein
MAKPLKAKPLKAKGSPFQRFQTIERVNLWIRHKMVLPIDRLENVGKLSDFRNAHSCDGYTDNRQESG